MHVGISVEAITEPFYRELQLEMLLLKATCVSCVTKLARSLTKFSAIKKIEPCLRTPTIAACGSGYLFEEA